MQLFLYKTIVDKYPTWVYSKHTWWGYITWNGRKEYKEKQKIRNI